MVSRIPSSSLSFQAWSALALTRNSLMTFGPNSPVTSGSAPTPARTERVHPASCCGPTCCRPSRCSGSPTRWSREIARDDRAPVRRPIARIPLHNLTVRTCTSCVDRSASNRSSRTGFNAASSTGLRPFSIRSRTERSSTVVPHATVMVSLFWPTSSAISTPSGRLASSRFPVLLAFLNPAASTVTV